jgi:uncharacterized protein YcfL
MKIASVLIVSLMILSSCSHKDEAIELSREFFASLSDSTYGKPHDFYPDYDALGIEAKSDNVDIEASDVTEKNDSFTVRCYNNYTNSEGTFKQDSVTLFITKNKNKQYYIYDSRGLIEMDKDLEWFGKVTGAFNKRLPNDQALTKRIEQVRSMMWDKFEEVRAELATKVKIVNWSWETSYSGEANGEGRVVNNLDYCISGVKYHVYYYDRRGHFMAEDDGSIGKTLYPGEKYDFTFWSSNAKYPNAANIRLDFSDNMVFDLIKEQAYIGTEFQEYLKRQKTK